MKGILQPTFFLGTALAIFLSVQANVILALPSRENTYCLSYLKQSGFRFFSFYKIGKLNTSFLQSNAADTFYNNYIIQAGNGYRVEKHFDPVSKTWYLLTYIDHQNNDGKPMKLQLALTDQNKSMGETAGEFASRTGAELVFNASMSTIVHTPSGKKRIPVGIQIINGKIVYDRPTKRYILGIKDNDQLVVYPPGTTAQAILKDGTKNALTAFVPLIENYQVSKKTLDDVRNLSVKNPRQIIAQFGDLNIVFLTCGGRSYGGEGMTAKEAIRILRSLDVKFAYNLDGGGSISTVADGKFLDWKIDDHGTKERLRANFLYVK